MFDADRPMLPPVSRLEYTHGDTTVIVEMPPDSSDLLVIAWTNVVKDLICERFGLPRGESPWNESV